MGTLTQWERYSPPMVGISANLSAYQTKTKEGILIMARIERNTITGTGNGTVAFDGWQFANVYSIGPIEIEYIKDGVTSNVPLEDERLIIQPGVLTVNVKTQPDNAWEFRLQNSIPEENQSELKIWKSGSGSTNISADDNIVFRGQER